jgi:hypothetical protein
MAQDRNGAAGDHCQRLHVVGEHIDLHAIDLVAGKGAGQSIDADILRLDVACLLIELAIEIGYFDLAALTDGT